MFSVLFVGRCWRDLRGSHWWDRSQNGKIAGGRGEKGHTTAGSAARMEATFTPAPGRASHLGGGAAEGVRSLHDIVHNADLLGDGVHSHGILLVGGVQSHVHLGLRRSHRRRLPDPLDDLELGLADAMEALRLLGRNVEARGPLAGHDDLAEVHGVVHGLGDEVHGEQEESRWGGVEREGRRISATENCAPRQRERGRKAPKPPELSPEG